MLGKDVGEEWFGDLGGVNLVVSRDTDQRFTGLGAIDNVQNCCVTVRRGELLDKAKGD